MTDREPRTGLQRQRFTRRRRDFVHDHRPSPLVHATNHHKAPEIDHPDDSQTSPRARSSSQHGGDTSPTGAKGAKQVESHEYIVGVSFTTEGRKYPIHIALRSIDSIVVKAGSMEEAEAQADQIRSALEEYANSVATFRFAAEPLLCR